MEYQPQVTKEHYFSRSYDTKDRWISYWYQIDAVLGRHPSVNVLEIGPGNRTVSEALRKKGISVTTADIASDLNPDVRASVTDLPFDNDSFDVVLAAEILEHLPFEEVPRALTEIRRITKRFAVVSAPHAGYVFSLEFKIPLFRRVSWIWKLPFFWKLHRFNGEHYWEMGKCGYSIQRVKKIFTGQGFSIKSAALHADDPAHYFFILEKIPIPAYRDRIPVRNE